MAVMSKHCTNRNDQYGVTMLVSMLILIVLGATFLFSVITGNTAKLQREQKTLFALSQAKKALLGYAASVNLVHPGCGVGCRRPGDLPCPDLDNDGVAETSCGNASGLTGQVNRLGRLPWRTLGLDDLRDGNGDRLWYAVSNAFKQNVRTRPLNSNTLGTISLRDRNGNLIQNATSASGVVAVVISAGVPITRQDALVQSRTLANENNPTHYLDNALGEDNANFTDSGTNGFIKGFINDASGNVILNDQLITLSQPDMMRAISPRVANEVLNALSTYHSVNSVYPNPANFSDQSCLGFSQINAGFCMPDLAVNKGRIPVNPLPDWNATSIFVGTSNNNWFQQNGWRELIYYSHGTLTLMLEGASKSLVVIVTGSVVGPQIRASNFDKTLEANYLELENLTPLDDTFLHLPLAQHGNTFNDFLVTLP